MLTILKKNKLIFSDFFKDLIKNDPFIMVDAGARGEIEEPWKSLDRSCLKILGFEPDNKACSELNQTPTNNIYYPIALWSGKSTLTIHITANPSSSSVYEPNIDLIKKYENKNWETKVVKKTIQCLAESLDEILKTTKLKPDFIKIDTQGAEYEILSGALNTIKNDVFGVLTETWTLEVYKNQPTTEKILEFMRKLDFDLFEINRAAAWKRKVGKNLTLGKKQIIGLDLLFLKKNYSSFSTYEKLLKAVAIAEVYGYPDYSIEMIEWGLKLFKNKTEDLIKIKNILMSNSNRKENLLIKIINKTKKILFKIRVSDYPSLHS